jgi:type IX secretion system PorP/SprF family membrane protein
MQKVRNNVLAGFLMFWVSTLTSILYAQSFPASSHFVWNPQADQPALTGVSDGIRMTGGYRYQWTNIEGAPMTAYAGVDMALPIKNSSGGIWLNHDRTGAMSFTQAKLSYAYKIPLGKSFISAGLHAGLMSISLDGSKLVTPGGGTGSGDDLLPVDRNNGLRAEIGAGIAYVHPAFYTSVAIHNAPGLTSKISGVNADFRADYGRYITFQGGGNIRLNDNISLKPSVLMRTDLKNYQLELVALASLKERFTLGAGMRGYNNNSLESLLALMSIEITDNLSVRYSYDVNLLALNAVSRGSHEFSLGYTIPKDTPSRRGKTLSHPRFL